MFSFKICLTVLITFSIEDVIVYTDTSMTIFMRGVVCEYYSIRVSCQSSQKSSHTERKQGRTTVD